MKTILLYYDKTGVYLKQRQCCLLLFTADWT